MAFKETVKSIVANVEGALGAVILGYDGIAIEECINETGSDLDIQVLAVEYSSLLKEVKKTVAILKSGEMEEVSIITGRTQIVIRSITSEFFIVLVMKSEGNFGKGRYLLKRHAPELALELR